MDEQKKDKKIQLIFVDHYKIEVDPRTNRTSENNITYDSAEPHYAQVYVYRYDHNTKEPLSFKKINYLHQHNLENIVSIESENMIAVGGEFTIEQIDYSCDGFEYYHSVRPSMLKKAEDFIRENYPVANALLEVSDNYKEGSRHSIREGRYLAYFIPKIATPNEIHELKTYLIKHMHSIKVEANKEIESLKNFLENIKI